MDDIYLIQIHMLPPSTIIISDMLGVKWPRSSNLIGVLEDNLNDKINSNNLKLFALELLRMFVLFMLYFLLPFFFLKYHSDYSRKSCCLEVMG